MNICADCQNPTNFCSWEQEFKPVPGWTAKKTKVLAASASKDKDSQHIDSYDVISCPLFKPYPGYQRKDIKPRPVIVRDIVTGSESTFPSIRSAAAHLGVPELSLKYYATREETVYGNIVRFAEGSDTG